MFTGIVEAVGSVTGVSPQGGGLRAAVQVPDAFRDVRPGDSVAVDGCCLTVVEIEGRTLLFDLVAETLARTTFGGLRPGRRVNLERALRVGDRLGGHFVTGHVDAVGVVSAIERGDRATEMKIEAPARLVPFLIEKGSIAVDGVSLTIAGLEGPAFRVALVPHTLAVTTLGERAVGERVHLEADLLVKAVERLLACGRIERPLAWEELAGGPEGPPADREPRT